MLVSCSHTSQCMWNAHILYNKIPYLISFNNSKIDLPIYDLVNLYKISYDKTDFSVLLSLYQNKYPLTNDELKLLFIYISIPDKIVLSGNELEDIKNIKKLINKITKSDKLIRPFYEKKESKKKWIYVYE